MQPAEVLIEAAHRRAAPATRTLARGRRRLTIYAEQNGRTASSPDPTADHADDALADDESPIWPRGWTPSMRGWMSSSRRTTRAPSAKISRASALLEHFAGRLAGSVRLRGAAAGHARRRSRHRLPATRRSAARWRRSPRWRPTASAGFMTLDAHTRRNLELFESGRGGGVKGSLLGARLARARRWAGGCCGAGWASRCSICSACAQRQEAVAAALDDVALRARLAPLLAARRRPGAADQSRAAAHRHPARSGGAGGWPARGGGGGRSRAGCAGWAGARSAPPCVRCRSLQALIERRAGG